MQGERYFLSREAGRRRRSCLCSKNKGLTNVNSMVNNNTFSPIQFSNFLYERRLARLGGRCQAIVNLLMGISYPCRLVSCLAGSCPEESLPSGAKVIELPSTVGLLGGRVDGGRLTNSLQYPFLILSKVGQGLSA